MNSNTPLTDAKEFRILSQLQSGAAGVVGSSFAREMERELNELRQAFSLQRDNYLELVEAVQGEGCLTCEVRDVVEMARNHRKKCQTLPVSPFGGRD